MKNLEEEMFDLIRTEVFSELEGDDIHYISGIGEAARLIAGFIEENYEPKFK